MNNTILISFIHHTCADYVCIPVFSLAMNPSSPDFFKGLKQIFNYSANNRFWEYLDTLLGI